MLLVAGLKDLKPAAEKIGFFSAFALAALAGAVLFYPSEAYAWGIETHIAITRKVADTLLLNGPYSVSGLIAGNSTEFLLGNIIPDIFAFKEWFFKPASSRIHGWEMAHRLLKNSRQEDEAAFSLGFMSHLAADVICHNFFIPQYIFKWDHRLKMTHVIAETQVEGYMRQTGKLAEVNQLLGQSNHMEGFLIESAGLKKGEFYRNKSLLRKSLTFKEKSSIDSLIFRNAGKDRENFIMGIDQHIDLSVRLASSAVQGPFSTRALNYCPDAEERMNLSRIRRRLSIRSKSIEGFKKDRQDGKFDYIHRVPAHLTAETV